MTFKVLAERCDQCLYGKNRIVPNARRAQIIQHITREDGYFICHKSTIAGGDPVACRGDWDQRKCGKIGRFAEWLGTFVFVPEGEL